MEFILGLILGIFLGAFIANKSFRGRIIKEIQNYRKTHKKKEAK